MSEIICPYCCKHFQPTRMVFRLKKSLQEAPKEERQDDWGVQSRRGRKLVDEKLKSYYMDIENFDERTAEQNATVEAEAIAINFADMMGDITDYNDKMYSEKKFVLELTYKGQHLTQRLCPFCHNELIPNAGLYDMKVIALYGDTNVGKTVYLNILQAALGGDPRLNFEAGAFRGSMFFQGNDTEIEEHNKNFEGLLNDHRLPPATPGGQVVRPQVFRYSYRTADRPKSEVRNLLIVFRDIPGEDVNSPEKMRRYAFYLKNADGMLVLLDSSKLTQVVPFLMEDGAGQGRARVADAVGNLAEALAVEFGGERIPIPTAVVLAKADVLEKVPIPEVKDVYDKVIRTAGAKQVDYIDRRAVSIIDRGVKKILNGLNEQSTILYPVENIFKEYNYFAISALGENPTEQDGEKVVQQLRPFRVSEPFYWLLSRMDCIPYYHAEKWRSNRGQEVKVELYYYERERSGEAQRRLEQKKEAQGIRNRVFGPKWDKIAQNADI